MKQELQIHAIRDDKKGKRAFVLSPGAVCREDDPAGWVVDGETCHAGRQGELVPAAMGKKSVTPFATLAHARVAKTGKNFEKTGNL
jgi:hypothetical protein